MSEKVTRRFGFPVKLVGFEMRELGAHRVVDVNSRRLAEVVATKIALKEGSLSGEELRFLRKRLGLSMSDFGARLGVSHAAVSKWESCEERCTRMGLAKEILAREMLLATVQSRSLELIAPRLGHGGDRLKWLQLLLKYLIERCSSAGGSAVEVAREELSRWDSVSSLNEEPFEFGRGQTQTPVLGPEKGERFSPVAYSQLGLEEDDNDRAA